MKCRFLYATPINDPEHPLHGKTIPVGGVFEGPVCFWLCNLHRSFLRPLSTLKGSETFELVTMDGSTSDQPAKLLAEPADQECLDECLRRGWNQYKDFKLKPEQTPARPSTQEPQL
jgi:hypothetical protein